MGLFANYPWVLGVQLGTNNYFVGKSWPAITVFKQLRQSSAGPGEFETRILSSKGGVSHRTSSPSRKQATTTYMYNTQQ